MKSSIAVVASALFLVAGVSDTGDRGENDGWRAFTEVASVLTHPRCLNCHVPGDSPLQGDQSRPHAMNVRRGDDGRGTPAARCTNCHQAENSPLPHSPPGAPDWRLPPPSTRLAWQGLATEEICRRLKDPARNGGFGIAQLVEHVTSDRFVNWGWNPGRGRKTPPLSHEEFVRRFVQWTESGAPCGPISSRSADGR
jgi:hypothetical protein